MPQTRFTRLDHASTRAHPETAHCAEDGTRTRYRRWALRDPDTLINATGVEQADKRSAARRDPAANARCTRACATVTLIGPQMGSVPGAHRRTSAPADGGLSLPLYARPQRA